MWSILSVIAVNLTYSVIAIVLVIAAMFIGFRVIDYVTDIEPEDEMKKGNISVGIFYAGMFIGIGIAIGSVLSRSLT